MKKILLIYPKHEFSKTLPKLPLSLLYLAKPLIADGRQVDILDQRVLSDFYDKLKEKLLNGVLCAGISTMSGIQLKYAVEITSFIKDNFPQTLIVWGGYHPTLFPKETLLLTDVDVIVSGEGEATFSELVNALRDNQDLSKVQGIYFKRNGEVIFTGDRDPIDINSISDLPYHLIDAGKNMTTYIKGEKSLLYVPDRGCPNKCKFCSRIFKTVRLADAKTVIKDLLKFLELGVNTIDIGSENFFLSSERVRQICEYLIKNEIKITLKASCSLGIIDKWDMSFLELLKKAGFDFIQVGVESGSDRILRLVTKNITVEEALRVNEKLKLAGIAPMYSFFIGTPSESKEEVVMTMDLVFELLKNNPAAATTNLQKYKPFPGTELFDIAVKEYGYKKPDNIKDWINLSDVAYPWVSKQHQKFIDTISTVSYFFDGKSVANILSANRLLKGLIKLYSKTVNYRCMKRLFWCFPENLILKKMGNNYA